MSGVRVPHLQCRNGIYHLRVRVPACVQPKLGLREVRRSLGSCGFVRAKALVPTYVHRVKGVFGVIQNTNVTKEQARVLVQACFRRLVAETEGWAIVPGNIETAEFELTEQLGLSEDRVSSLREQLGSRVFDGSVQLIAQNELAPDLDFNPARRLDFLEGVARALIEQQNLFQLRLTNRLQPFAPTDSLFADLDGPAQSSSPVTAAVVPVVAVGPTVAEAAALYLSAGKKRWVRKTHTARVWQIGFLEESLGSTKRLSAVTSHDVRRFRDQILSLRANHGRRQHLTFAERQTENVDRRIAPKTAAIIFETCKAFFTWAKRDEGMIAINPAEDVRIALPKKPKGKRTRRPFTAAELSQLFSSPVFTGCRSRHRRFEPGEFVYRDAKFWIPVLSFYTGARMGELVQLHVSDVVLDGIPHISINEDVEHLSPSAEGKHVKSEAGVRMVPLHPDLMDLGFEKFVERAKTKGKSKRLFPEVEYGIDGQASSRFSKWFARMMDKSGLTDPALVFHSFRHNAEDALRNAEKHQYIIDRLIGHSDGSTSAGYGDGISLEVGYDAIKAMRLPVRIPELLAQYKPD